MDYLEQHPWRNLIIAPIEASIEQEIDETNADWEYIDGEMVKLGSLEHELLDIEQVQKIALLLLSSKSKDLRILAHLLRTLQHSGAVLELLLALQLFYDYVERYWQKAAPIGTLKKYRLTSQIIKRFENAANSFRQSASRLEQETAITLLQKLHDYWSDNQLEQEIQTLLTLYTMPSEKTDSIENTQRQDLKQIDSFSMTTVKAEKLPVIEPIEIDTSNERAWKNTLFKVVDYLLERDISCVLGYQLRRYAIWNNITSTPVSEGNKTPLSPPSIDRVSDYEKAMSEPTLALWKDIEHSLTVSPYWFEGHYLSANIAMSLGYQDVAIGIKKSLQDFLDRLPQLKNLCFNDNTAFCSDRLSNWLNEKANLTLELSHSYSDENLFDIAKNEGISIALAQLNNKQNVDLRDKFYDQITLADLLVQQGFDQIAKQHYFAIYTAIQQLPIKDWETSLYTLLQDKLEINE